MFSLIGSDEELNVGDFSLENTRNAAGQVTKKDDAAAHAKRTAEQLRFRLKEAMAQRGGSEAFLNWLRSDSGKHA